MDLDALRFANFKTLDDAVSDWHLLVRHLADLKKDAEDGLHQAANKADWAGLNAQVTKEFVGKTAGEFDDAHTEARTVYNILSDTRDELKQDKKDLEAAIDRGLKKNLTVMDTGNGTFTVTMNIHPDRAAHGTTVPEHDESDVTALRDEVQGILKKATESDNSAKKVLMAISDEARMGFADANYKDRDSAAKAIETADNLAKIAAKNPASLTPADFDKIEAGLAKYKHDPLFSEEFATRLGPKRTLEFWEGINDPAVNMHLGHDRVDQFEDLQRNLGMTLATATQSDSASMASWKGNMIRLGDQPVGHGAGPMGFQVMSNLMRTGDYDDQFLKSYGTALMATERNMTDNGKHANVTWGHMGTDPWLNRIGDDSGDDPLTGYLKGLSNSPAAATDFFNEDFLPKDDDHKHAISNFKYLFEDRHWPLEPTSGSEAGHNNLALALEAATTGHPAGEIPTLDTPAHTKDQAHLFNQIVTSVGDDTGRLTNHSYMSDSMGQMASEYLPDINRATTDVSRSSSDWDQIKKLYPIDGADAVLDHRDVSKFLFAVGQNPKGYSAVEVGQETYMSKLMAYHLDPNLPANDHFSHDPQTTVSYIAQHSGEVSGTLGLGRQEEVAQKAGADDSAYNNSVAQRTNLISGTVGTVVGVGTSFIGSPAVGAAVGGAAGTVTGAVLQDVFKDSQGHALADASDDMGRRWQIGLKQNNEYVSAGAEAAANKYHLANESDVGVWARTGARQGYLNAENILDGQAPGSRTTP
ncbi:hypothetical protein [Streptomyces beihaiensis]|uniref:AG2 protein n=1 Tax=Streptomyces beihaiensis TaxID=2984495 RepID=A0ABT3TYT0_9ACTN|nr:hypothetical protein [Streptomyces beihaiensis]MCX3062195.1 hypothetical protein [Streptomyces beihaiensis]